MEQHKKGKWSFFGEYFRAFGAMEQKMRFPVCVRARTCERCANIAPLLHFIPQLTR